MIKSMKILSLIFLFLLILLQTTPSSAQQYLTLYKVTILINNKVLKLNQPPIMNHNRVLVPLRSIFEALGATVQWDSNNQTVTAIKDNNTINLAVGHSTADKNGESVSIDVPPILKQGRVYVPIRFITESLGSKVVWNEQNQTISVYNPSGSSLFAHSLIQQNSLTNISSRSNGIQLSRFMNLVTSLEGIPYLWGGESLQGFDCSGFTSYVMKYFGITLPRTATEQYNTGYSVSKEQLILGDLLFFDASQSGQIDHVGIYIGNNKMVHASLKGVEINDLNWYFKHYKYYGAKRVLPQIRM